MFFTGLGGAMLIAIYDYFGYYNVCHLGDEVVQPEKNDSPGGDLVGVDRGRALPDDEHRHHRRRALAAGGGSRRTSRPTSWRCCTGETWRSALRCLIIWTALASTFVMTLGYSRILYAAARNGDFFQVFAYLHPRGPLSARGDSHAGRA